MIVYRIVMTIILVILALYDIKYLKVPIVLLAIGIIYGLIINSVCFLAYKSNVFDFILRVQPALLLLLLHFIKPEDVGLGDGMALLISEMSNTLLENMVAIMIIGITSIIVSLVLIIRRSKTTRIPYVFFIMLGHVIAEVSI